MLVTLPAIVWTEDNREGEGEEKEEGEEVRERRGERERGKEELKEEGKLGAIIALQTCLFSDSFL
jgi:hypothetical protein